MATQKLFEKRVACTVAFMMVLVSAEGEVDGVLYFEISLTV